MITTTAAQTSDPIRILALLDRRMRFLGRSAGLDGRGTCPGPDLCGADPGPGLGGAKRRKGPGAAGRWPDPDGAGRWLDRGGVPRWLDPAGTGRGPGSGWAGRGAGRKRAKPAELPPSASGTVCRERPARPARPGVERPVSPLAGPCWPARSEADCPGADAA